ncbi:MAG: discoidin domain-containing protein [Oscillospiraceae bacterium]|nr:discoidin domain-containing protein [Oscillospiraceae bacterium]
MKRSNWVRLIAVILIISMLAAPVSAATNRGSDGVRANGLIGTIVEIIRDIIRDIFDDWFDKPGDGEPVPTEPIETTAPTAPGETEPTEPGETEPGETKPTTPGETKPTEPGETEPDEPELNEPPQSPDNDLELIEGHANTANGHLLRGVTYSLANIIAQQGEPLTTATANRFGTKLGNSLGGNAVSTGLKTMASKGGIQTMADTQATAESVKIEGITGVASSYNQDENSVAANAFDGQPNTYWASAAGGKVAEQYLITDLGGEYTIDKVVYTKRYDSGAKYNCTGNLLDYIIEVRVGEDGEWQQVASGATVSSDTDGTTEITFNAVPATHVRLRATQSYHWDTPQVNTVMTCAEFEVYGYAETIDPSDDSRDIPTSVLTATAGNSQTNQGPENTLDGNDDTLWHTSWDGSSRDTHWIQFQLSADYNVDGLRYRPRQGSGDGSQNGLITEYEIQISADGQTFTPVTTGTWSYSDRSWKIATFDAVNTKYVRLVVKDAQSNSTTNLYASAAEIRLTGEVIETPEPEVPVEPEQPAIGSEVVFFPVTMFNYNNGISELNDDDIMRNLTHQAEVEAGLKEKWEGLYFSGGKPAPTSYTYTTEAASHSDLSWQQVMDGTYYADEAYTEQVTVEPITEGGSEWNAITLTASSDWVEFPEYANSNYYYKDGSNYELITYTISYAYGYWYVYTGENQEYHSIEAAELTIYAHGGEVTGYNLVAGDQTLATLDGTDLTTKVDVTLYTAAGEVTVNKSYAEWNWWAYETDGDAARNKFYAGLVQDELVDGELKFNVAEPGIFTFDSAHPEITNDGIKDIYQHVGLPFVKNAKGYYTFDSDANGTYFADTNGDGKSDPWYGAEDDFFNMYLDYGVKQGWDGMYYGDGSTNLWAPYNTNANDTGEGAIDYHFGMRADIPFSMTPNGRIKSTDDNSEPITFTFKGDDDVWIFIDGHLVIDLGGIHNRLGATIDFANNTITYFKPESNTNTNEFGAYNVEDFELVQKLYSDADGEGALGQTRANFSTVVDHEMSIFYLERGKGTSNCQIEFNLPMLDTVLVTKDITHSWSAREDELDGPDKDGTAPLTAKEQAAVDKLDFDFKLWKKEIGGRYTAVANTNYYLLDKEDNILGIYTTGTDGTFSLKNGQTAMFMTDLGNGTVTYAVEELDLDLDTFLTPDYKFAGLATDGFDFYGETLNNDTEDENDTKLVEKHLDGNASQIGEQELPMDAVQLVSYDVTPYGSIEAIESLEFICTNYLNAELPNPTARAYEDIIVIDYGLPVQVDPLHNDLFRGDDIEIVTWGDETLELNEVLESNQIYAVPYGTEGGTTWSGNKVLAAAKVAASNNSYNDNLIDLADCLYTFKDVGDGCYEVSATTADGTKVYLNHYTSDTNEIPHDSIPGRIKVENGSIQNMFKLIAQTMTGGTGSARTLHFHTEQTVPYWNRCGNDNTYTCQEYLYRPAGKDDVSSTEIPGYVMVTSVADIVDGGQYLIVHDKDASSTEDDMFVLHPSTSGDKYHHVAKLETTNAPAIGSAFSFDFGTVKFNDVTYAETVNADGTITFTRDSFEYELTEQMTEVEEIRYIIKVNSTVEEEIGDETVTKTACRYALGKVYIVPATIMYYEENFNGLVKFTNANGAFTPEQKKEASYVSPYQEPGVVGTVGDSTYGSDDAYERDPYDSNGTSYFFDTTNGYVRFQYTFTGTGTSIFARTSANTGYMQVLLFNGALDDATQYVGDKEYQKDVWYRDTFYNDANNTDLDGESLYNIPVYTNNELDYGTYTILVTVAKAGTPGAGPNLERSGNEFYLDGIRIMQPLNESADETLTEKALDAYAADGESNLVVETLRQKLITDVKEGEAVWDGENFVVLTDTNGAITAAEDYISYGPKEEVYLARGQKISFSMKYWKPQGLKLYIGMKAPFGTVGTDDVGPYSAKLNVGKNSFTLRNATDCYYDVTDMQEKLEAVYFQAEDANGNLLFTDADGNELYMDADGYFWNKETNEPFTVADGVVIYMDDEGNFWNSETGEKYEGEDKPTPVYTDEIDYYIITYTFEATDSIVALTNIKVVGNFEFIIIEDNEETQEGGGTGET